MTAVRAAGMTVALALGWVAAQAVGCSEEQARLALAAAFRRVLPEQGKQQVALG